MSVVVGGAGLTESERLARLRLARSENVGPVTFLALIERFKTAQAALAAMPALAQRGGKRAIRVATKNEAEAEMAAIATMGARLIVWGDADYPALLAHTEDPPPTLTWWGERLPADGTRFAAIVGARNASAAGLKIAHAMALELAEAGVTVVSGLARGIDTAAHAGALAADAAFLPTLAVVAGGANVIYPPENFKLHAAVRERGAIVAEQAPGTEPQARHFPRRNRIISGLSRVVIVVEAAERSGSLITARFAGAQGRDVAAVPGSPLDPRSGGSNGLIRDGATLVRHAADVLDDWPATGDYDFAAPTSDFLFPSFAEAGSAIEPDSAAHQVLVSLLSPTPVSIDELVRLSGFTPALVQAILVELELAGRLTRYSGQQVALQ